MTALEDARNRRGVKVNAVAAALGVDRRTYRKYERNPKKMSVEQAKAVCDFLGCSVEDIFLSEKVSVTNLPPSDEQLSADA